MRESWRVVGGRKGGGPITAFAMAVLRIPVSPYPYIPVVAFYYIRLDKDIAGFGRPLSPAATQSRDFFLCAACSACNFYLFIFFFLRRPLPPPLSHTRVAATAAPRAHNIPRIPLYIPLYIPVVSNYICRYNKTRLRGYSSCRVSNNSTARIIVPDSQKMPNQ